MPIEQQESKYHLIGLHCANEILKKGGNTMSAEENKAVLRRIEEEIFNKGDLAVVDELIAPDYVYHGSGGQEYKGPEGFKQIVTMFRTAFPDLHMT